MKKRVYIVIMFIFFLYMFVSTPIIARIYGSENIREIKSIESYSSQPVYFAIDKMELLNNTIELLSCSGWAFVETDDANENREVSLILRNNSKCYELRTVANTTQRVDVLNAFPTHRIPHYNIGFYIDYSILNVQSGIYEVLIYCKENEQDYGLVNTGMKVEKREESITLLSN